MPQWLNILLQVSAVIAQVGDWEFLPPKWKIPVSTLIGLFQAVVAVLAHNYNPDGTPAAVAYVKGGK